MPNKGELFGFLSAMVLVIGCASTSQRASGDEALLPEIDVMQVKDKTDEALKLAQEVNLDVDVLSTKIADLDNRIVTLSDEVSSISAAKIEELETRLVILTEALKESKAQAVQVAQVAPPAQIVKASPPSSTPPVGKAKPGASRDTAAKAKNAAPLSTFAPSTAASLLVSPEFEAYQTGLRLFQGRNYDRAIKAFDEMLAQFPSGKYADNANYWIGESFFFLSDYSSAIGAFEKVVAYHGSIKADDAYYKIGLAYLKMGQPGAAKEAFRHLIENYPASDYVSRAQRYLQRLK
jgi:tol-pal system protein YbgF